MINQIKRGSPISDFSDKVLSPHNDWLGLIAK